MGINKKVSAGLLAFAVMGGITGCIPAPYEQNVPATTYTVDENGNKVKVQHNGKKSESSLVSASADAFYNNIFDGTLAKEMEELQPKMIAEAEKQGISIDEEPPVDFMYSMYTESGLSYAKLSHISDPEKIDKKKYVTDVQMTMMVSAMSKGEMSIKFDPGSVIMVDENHATIDFNKATLKNTKTGETTKMPPAEEGKLFQFVKVDGKWLFDMNHFMEHNTNASIAPMNSSNG